MVLRLPPERCRHSWTLQTALSGFWSLQTSAKLRKSATLRGKRRKQIWCLFRENRVVLVWYYHIIHFPRQKTSKYSPPERCRFCLVSWALQILVLTLKKAFLYFMDQFFDVMVNCGSNKLYCLYGNFGLLFRIPNNIDAEILLHCFSW